MGGFAPVWGAVGHWDDYGYAFRYAEGKHPSATVIVRNIDTGIDRTLTTNDAGIYVAPFCNLAV